MWIVGWVPRILVGNLKFFECIEREGDGGNDDDSFDTKIRQW